MPIGNDIAAFNEIWGRGDYDVTNNLNDLGQILALHDQARQQETYGRTLMGGGGGISGIGPSNTMPGGYTPGNLDLSMLPGGSGGSMTLSTSPIGGGGGFGSRLWNWGSSLLGGGSGGDDSMGWSSWIPLISSGIGAVSNYAAARQGRDAAQAANAPQHFSSTSSMTPPFGIGGIMQGLVNDSMTMYNNQRRNMPQVPGYRGVNPNNFNLGPSSAMNGLVEDMIGRARGGSANLDAASNYVTGRLNNPNENAYHNPFLSRTYEAANQPGSANAGYQAIFDRIMSGKPQVGSAGGAGGFGTTVGGFGGSSSGPSYQPVDGYDPDYTNNNNYSNPLLSQYFEDTLSGKYINSNPYLDEIADRITERSGDLSEVASADYLRREMGAGRYGRGRYGKDAAAIQEGIADANQGQLANLYGSSYENERGIMNLAANLLNSRDVSQWNDVTARDLARISDQTSRYGIDTNANISKYGIDSSAASARNSAQSSLRGVMESIAAQERMHGLDTALGAMAGLNNSEMGRLGIMGELSGMYGEQDLGFRGLNSAESLAALQMVPSLEEAGWLGYNNAFGATMSRDQMRAEAERARLATAQSNARGRHAASMARYNQRLNYMPGVIDDQIRRMSGIASIFGTQNSSGVNPGANVQVPSTGGSALSGALSGLQLGLGLMGQFNQNRGVGNPNVFTSALAQGL